MSRLGVRLDADERARRRRARRVLLRRPLQIREECGDLWKDIVSERRALAEWFMTHAGWKLVVDVSAGFARLHKTSRDAGFRRRVVPVH